MINYITMLWILMRKHVLHDVKACLGGDTSPEGVQTYDSIAVY